MAVSLHPYPISPPTYLPTFFLVSVLAFRRLLFLFLGGFPMRAGLLDYSSVDLDGWRDGWMDGWMQGWMQSWMDGWMDE